MARQKNTTPAKVGEPTVRDKDRALGIIDGLLAEAETVKTVGRDSTSATGWRHKASVALANLFGENSETHTRFGKIHYSPAIVTSGMPDSFFERSFRGGMAEAIEILRAARYQVETFFTSPESEENNPVGRDVANLARRYDPKSKRVFVVHGRDDSLKLEVARFLERGGLDPVILHEQPNMGKTIIEKFEANAVTATFAVVLLTADDVGGLASGSTESLSPRARQNVVLEYGYFIGALGRDRVCAIIDEGVEEPSDMEGIVYIRRSQDWMSALTRELVAAGVPFDLRRAFSGTP